MRTLRRGTLSVSDRTPILRALDSGPFPSSNGAILSYLAMLDHALDDLVLTPDERSRMQTLAEQVGLRSEDVRVAHEAYLRSMVAAAMQDGVITAEEHRMMTEVASALDLESVPIPDVTELPAACPLDAGARVCFTGDAVVDGRTWSRADLEAAAASLGLQPVQSVTIKTCDVLVAESSSSQSGKAKKARKYGKPILALSEFVALTGLR